VYFLDNEDLYKRKYVFTDEDDKWFDDNGLRTVFFCKGALETVKKFGWPPDLIHCSGWMTGLIPFYLKSVYKREPVFSHSKVIYTIGQNTFTDSLGSDFIEKAMIHASLKEKDLEAFKAADNSALLRGGATFADAITFGSEEVDPKLVEEFSKVRGKKTLPFNLESDLTDYLQLYSDLAGK
jgi:starch synthase